MPALIYVFSFCSEMLAKSYMNCLEATSAAHAPHTILRPARVSTSSCVPPAHPEPFQPSSASLVDTLAMHDQLRELQV